MKSTGRFEGPIMRAWFVSSSVPWHWQQQLLLKSRRLLLRVWLWGVMFLYQLHQTPKYKVDCVRCSKEKMYMCPDAMDWLINQVNILELNTPRTIVYCRIHIHMDSLTNNLMTVNCLTCTTSWRTEALWANVEEFHWALVLWHWFY